MRDNAGKPFPVQLDGILYQGIGCFNHPYWLFSLEIDLSSECKIDERCLCGQLAILQSAPPKLYHGAYHWAVEPCSHCSSMKLLCHERGWRRRCKRKFINLASSLRREDTKYHICRISQFNISCIYSPSLYLYYSIWLGQWQLCWQYYPSAWWPLHLLSDWRVGVSSTYNKPRVPT